MNVLALLLLSSTAFAAEGPLLVKSSHSGFTHPDWVRNEACEVYPDRVVITRVLGSGDAGVKAVETRKVSISHTIVATIAKAAAEPVKETPNSLCDAPGTYVKAAIGEGFLLFSTGGCGSPKQERDGSFSKILRDLVDLYCPKTFDYSDES